MLHKQRAGAVVLFLPNRRFVSLGQNSSFELADENLVAHSIANAADIIDPTILFIIG